MARGTLWVTLTIIGSGGWACGPQSFDTFPDQDGGPAEDASLGEDAGNGEDAAQPEATIPTVEDASVQDTSTEETSDSAADTWAPTDCSDLPKQNGAFVSPLGIDSPNCTFDAPCATIAAGVAFATRNARDTVYLDKGTYTETLSLTSGLTYSGGWLRNQSGSWQRICDDSRATAAVVHAPSAASSVADAVNLGGTATLDSVWLQSRAEPAQTGESLYGLRVIGTTSHVVLRSVRIDVAGGGAGAGGDKGSTGGAPPATCAPASSSPPQTPPSGANGAGAPPGTFTAAGWQASTGSVGAPGTGPGGNGVSQPWCRALLPTCDVQTCTVLHITCCSERSVPGCGGGPGAGGAGGRGGGSSVALFIWDGVVDADGTHLTSSTGGDGGPGGPGGSGGAPSTGSPGNANSCPGNTCTQKISPITNHLFCDTGTPQSSGTGPAYPGAVGATGGIGGGGGGGASYAVFVGGSGAFNPTANIVLTHGTGGKGGDAPNPGAPGVGADRN